MLGRRSRAVKEAKEAIARQKEEAEAAASMFGVTVCEVYLVASYAQKIVRISSSGSHSYSDSLLLATPTTGSTGPPPGTAHRLSLYCTIRTMTIDTEHSTAVLLTGAYALPAAALCDDLSRFDCGDEGECCTHRGESWTPRFLRSQR